jgi:hypothetical protein
MKENGKLGWSPLAMGQFLELPAAALDRVDHCVELIAHFPRMGNRVRSPGEHRRRFLCGDHWIVYRLEETVVGEFVEPQANKINQKEELPEPIAITIKYIRRDRGSSTLH